MEPRAGAVCPHTQGVRGVALSSGRILCGLLLMTRPCRLKLVCHLPAHLCNSLQHSVCQPVCYSFPGGGTKCANLREQDERKQVT